MEELRRSRHAVLLLPIGVTMMLFAWPFMFFWTGNAGTADRTFIFVSLLAAVTMLNALMSVPYALQLSFGWTGLALRCGLTAVVVGGAHNGTGHTMRRPVASLT